MSENIEGSKEYNHFLADLKSHIINSQYRAVRSVNTELINLYWKIGEGIHLQQTKFGWGAKIISKLASDLTKTFPYLKGFSRTNLYNISQWYLFFKDITNVQQLVGQIPWGA